jgi:hypothetical protein
LVQLGNTDSLNQFLKAVPASALSTREMKLALKVAGVLKRGEYAQFFRLLQEATPLQACLMHKYVADVRLRAMMKVVKASPKQTYYVLSDLVSILLFESDEEASSYLVLCGIKIDSKEVAAEGAEYATRDSTVVVKYAILDGQNILSLLPTDRNGVPLNPPAKMMLRGIDSRLNSYKTSDICRNL